MNSENWGSLQTCESLICNIWNSFKYFVFRCHVRYYATFLARTTLKHLPNKHRTSKNSIIINISKKIIEILQWLAVCGYPRAWQSRTTKTQNVHEGNVYICTINCTICNEHIRNKYCIMWNKWSTPQDNTETQWSNCMQRDLEAYLLDSEVQLMLQLSPENANILKINKKTILYQSLFCWYLKYPQRTKPCWTVRWEVAVQ